MKRIVITGAGQRIGLYLTRYFLSLGYEVIALVRRESEPLNEIVAQHYHSHVVIYDLQQHVLDKSFWKDVCKGKAIDGFIHCASTFEYDNAASCSIDNIQLQRRVNCDTFVHAATQYYQLAIENNYSMASFITLLDQKVHNINPDHYSYTISKLQLASVIPYLAQTLAPKLRINAISPGLTLPSGEQTQAQFDAVRSTFPLGYGNDCEDIAATAQFLLQQKSITGQTIAVDAGQHLMSDKDVIFK